MIHISIIKKKQHTKSYPLNSNINYRWTFRKEIQKSVADRHGAKNEPNLTSETDQNP